MSVRAEVIPGCVLVNGTPVPAEYTLLSDGTVGLGSGQNASISQYTTGRITVPSSIKSGSKTYRVTQIMPLAFRLCSKIEVVIVQEGVTRVGDFACIGCSSLKEVELPSTVKSIATGAFIGLDKLDIFTCKAPTPPVWEYNDVFFQHEKGIGDTGKPHFRQAVFLNVPTGAETAYLNSAFSNTGLGWLVAEGWGTTFININGSALENYRLYEPIDLWDLRRIANNPGRYGSVKQLWLEADIDMKDSLWTSPIGDTPEHAFSAKVHGQGHTISNLTIHSQGSVGLFGYYNGPSISGLRLRFAEWKGNVCGGVVGMIVEGESPAATRIDSCLVQANVVGSECAAGIVGIAQKKIEIDRCAVDRITILCLPETDSSIQAGIAGSVYDATITNCAVIGSVDNTGIAGPFVATGKASIDYSYASNSSFSGYTPPANIILGSHVITYGQPVSIVNYAGKKMNFTYDQPRFQSIFPASVLGFDGWAYYHGYYPLPDCLVDEWPVRANHAVYGSAAMAQTTINVLTPDEDIPASAWLDLSEMGFRHYRFKASQLWIDGKMSNYDVAAQIPLGVSRQITAEQGIILEDTLYAENQGTVPVKQPVYQKDEENNLVYDDEGNMIFLDSLYVFDRIVWKENIRPLCLPYNVALPENCTVYQPTSIYDVNGLTTALFERVRENYVEAFRPYLLVIHADSVPLGTLTRTVCPELSSATMRFGDYEYAGTLTSIGNVYARSNSIYMVEDEHHWLLTKQSDDLHSEVEPFSAYFRAIGTVPATRITMTLEDDNPVISVGDFYFTIDTEDAENVTATLCGYHGRGGNIVVPATAPYVSYGKELQVPVTNLAPDIFANNTAQLWSIDLSQCKDIPAVTVGRTTPGNPFYKVDERTIIYLPEGKAQPGKNVVVGTECASLTITDKWDFCPPYGFHADEAEYSRILYATKLQNGTYQSYAYTVCLPFGMSEADWDAADPDYHTVIYAMAYVNTTAPRAFVFANHSGNLGGSFYPQAGLPYIVVVREGQFQFKAHNTWVTDRPEEYESRVSLYGDLAGTVMGDFKGTFSRISNEDAAAVNAYSLSKGSWYRILSDEGSHRGAYVDAFRAYFAPSAPLAFNSYGTKYVWEPQGEEDFDYSDFPANDYVTDTDFSGYDDVIDGIQDIQLSPLSILNSNNWYTIDGRHVNGVPTEKGLYINKGRIIIIK